MHKRIPGESSLNPSPPRDRQRAFLLKRQLREIALRMEELRRVISDSRAELPNVLAALAENHQALERLRDAIATAQQEHGALEVRREELKAQLDLGPEPR